MLIRLLLRNDERLLRSASFKPDWCLICFCSRNYRPDPNRAGELVRPAALLSSTARKDYDLFSCHLTKRSGFIRSAGVILAGSTNSSAISVRQKPGQLEASRFAIGDHLKRKGEPAHVVVDWQTHAFCVKRELPEAKKISIIIPARGQLERSRRCIEGLTSKTSYPDYEIVVLKGDREPATGEEDFSQIAYRFLHFSAISNISLLRNFAVEQTETPWLLFLDDDIKVIESDWLTIMAEHVQRPEIGAVGAQLLNPSNTIEHAGIVLGVNGIAQPAFRGLAADERQVSRQVQVTRNCSAVSAACMLTRRDVFQEVGGFDESLPNAFADIDLCLKMRRAGYLIVYTPFAKLYKHEPRPEKIDMGSEAIMRERWPDVVQRDPYYNANLSRERADFSLGK